MAILKKKAQRGKVKIDITSPQGNAFCLLGYAEQYAKQLDKEWKPIEDDMKSGDYEHLLQVFDREFGDYVDLLR